MPQNDLPLHELRKYNPDHAAPTDLDEFWDNTLAEAREHPILVKSTLIDNSLAVIDTYDVSFAGFGGHRINAWLQVPSGTTGPLPTVIEYLGYGGGRGLAHERTLFAQAGYAHFVMDTRGQGSGWQVGDTPDPTPSSDPSHPGFMTQGILDKHDYYFRRLYTDAVRSIDAAVTLDLVDETRLAASGGSQGGGLAIAAASLDDRLKFIMPDVAFLCDLPRSITITGSDPYGEVQRFLKVHRGAEVAVLETLRYFDNAILGRKASANALFSVALMDEISPPSTVYAAYNAYGGPKEIVEYPFNNHEGGDAFHNIAKLKWLADVLDSGDSI